MSDHAPFLIIGQGLAGTAVAWQLWQRGEPFVIVDRDEAVTSSKIAAGLLTPITRMRISRSENYGPWWAEATRFYRARERLLGQRFLHAQPSVRLFKNEEEPKRWAKRELDAEVQRFVHKHPPTPLVDPALFNAPRGGFQMKHAGYLETALYLQASRRFFETQGRWVNAEFQLSDLMVNADNVQWQGQTFRQVIFCTGWEAVKHPWFEWVPFEPARGTILTARVDLNGERRLLNGGCWLQPRSDGTVRIGSTYEMKFSNPNEADPAKLADLHERIRRFIKVPVEVLGQQTAVRPIIAKQRTLIGRHPARPRVAFLNGLGSKGTLRSPFFARTLVEHLLDGTAIPPTMDLAGNF